MPKAQKQTLSREEHLMQALVPEDEQPYAVPENWVWVKLESIGKWGSGGTPSRKRPEFYTGDVLWIKTGELNDDYIYDTEEKITSDAIANSSAKIFPVNTVLVAMYGATIGKVAIVGVPATTNQACAGCVAFDGVYYRFLFFYAMSQKEVFINKGKGGAQPNISQEIIKAHPFPFPPLAEQHRIVTCIESLFEKLDRAKELVQSALDSFENRKAAIRHKAFTGELTAKWREENGVSLDSWESKPLRELVVGFKYGSNEKSDYSNKGIPVIRIPNIADGYIDFNDMKYLISENVSDDDRIINGDILIIRSNGSRDLVGKCALVQELDSPFAYASYLIRIRPKSKINPRFLLGLFQSVVIRSQLFVKAKSSAGINNINSKELGQLQIPVPLPVEQKEIVRILDSLLENEKMAQEFADTLEKIDHMKKSILARAFRGELGTNDSNEESAIELLKSPFDSNSCEHPALSGGLS